MHPVRPEHEPDLQATKAPAERDLPIAVVSHETAVAASVAQVRGGDRQGVDEGLAGAHVQERGVKVGEEPLVHVRIEGVEGSEVGGVVLVFGEDEGDAGVGGVDVSPERVGEGEGREGSGERGEIVDGAGGGGTFFPPLD